MFKLPKRTQLLPQAIISLLVAHSPMILAADTHASASKLTTVITQSVMQPDYVQLDGRLEAINQGTISAQTSGVVEVVNVDVNDSVQAGQVLVVINNTQQQAHLSQAQANLAQAEALNEDAQILLKRNRSLFAKRTLSQGELDSSIARAKSGQASVLAAKASVKQAKEQLSYTKVLAPYNGIVSQRFVQLGELVNPGQPLMAGFAIEPMRITTDIPQKLIQKLNISEDHPIQVLTQDDIINTQQYTLFPYADNLYSSVRARIDLPKSEKIYMPGSWVEVLLPIGSREGIFLPKSAIIQQGEVSSLYVKNPTTGTFKLRYIRIGQNLNTAGSETQVEIISGLTANEEVALDALATAAQIHSAQQVDTEQ